MLYVYILLYRGYTAEDETSRAAIKFSRRRVVIGSFVRGCPMAGGEGSVCGIRPQHESASGKFTDLSRTDPAWIYCCMG